MGKLKRKKQFVIFLFGVESAMLAWLFDPKKAMKLSGVGTTRIVGNLPS